MSWSLQITPAVGLASSRTLARWGLESNALRTGSLTTAEYTCRRPVQTIEQSGIAAFGDRVVLTDATGRVRFRGKRIHTTGNASGRDEHQQYRFADAWWDLTQRKYEQLWTTTLTVAGVSAKSTSYNPHLILCVGRSVAEEMTAVIEYAASQGVAIAVGSIIAPVYPPTDEVICRDCASILQQLAQWAPGNVAFIDYTPAVPSFNFLPEASLSLVTRAAYGVQGSESLSIEALHEDVASCVVIRYERLDSTTIDGVTRTRPVISHDVYPATVAGVATTGREERAFSELVVLAGSTRNTVTADLDVRAFPSNFEALAEVLTGGFWAEKQFSLPITDTRISQGSFEVVASSFTREAAHTEGDDAPALVAFPNYLVAGQIAPWMNDDNGDQILWQKQKLTLKVNYIQYADDTYTTDKETDRLKDKLLTIYLIATNAPTGLNTYSKDTAIEDAEQPLTGLAQYLYERLSVLRYRGQRRQIRIECDGAVQMGQRMHLTGGDPLWASMGAIIQSVHEDIDNGISSVDFGPVNRESLGLRIALSRAHRVRRRWTASEQQTTGEL